MQLSQEQNRILNILEENRFNLIEKPRQSGLTTALIHYLLGEALLSILNDEDGYTAHYVSSCCECVKNARTMVEDILGELPYHFVTSNIVYFGNNRIEFANGSTIHFVSVGRIRTGALRAHTSDEVIIDNASHIEELEDLCPAVFPCICSNGGKLTLATTTEFDGPLGSDFYEDLLHRTTEGLTSFKYTS